MKTSNLKLSLLTALATLGCALGLHGADLTWDADTATTGPQDGTNVWNTVTNTWWDGATNVTWNGATPDNATFGAGAGQPSAAAGVLVPSNTTNSVGNITFNAPGSGAYTLFGGSSTSSKLNLVGNPTITVASGVFATNLVVLSGTSFTKLGAGTFVLKPGAINTNSGPTVVGEGTLVIGVSAGRLVIPGDLTLTNSSTAILVANEQIADVATLTVNGSTFDMGSRFETLGKVILDNNGLILGTSGSTMITNATVYDVRSGIIFPNLAGAAGLTKTTAGTVILTNNSGANTFFGPILISAGILELGHSGAGNGLPGNTVTITNTGMLRLGKDTQLNTNAMVNVAGGTYELNNHNETVSTVILDNGGSILNAGSQSKTLTINSNMDFRNGICASKLGGTGLLVKSTAGTVVLTMDNANTGGMLISGGILELGDGSSTNRGQFGFVTVTNNAAIVLNHSSTFNLTNTISGSGSLTNLGGSPSITGDNTYSGGTTVSGGTLFVKNISGSATGSGTVTVNNATLAGNGTISGPVNIQSAGTLAPGNSAVGTLTINNTLTLGGNTTIEVNKGAGQDLVVANAVNYGGTLTVTDLGGGLVAGDTFQIFTAGSHTSNFTGISGSPGVDLAWSFDPASGVLTVINAGATPPILNFTQSGNSRTFSWAASGFKLQWQTNSLTTGLGTNWSDYPDTSNPVGVTINPASPAVFFRLSQ